MIIIGERLNSSREQVLAALKERDEAFLISQAKKQEEAGANYIDLNAAALMEEEAEALAWAIPLLQKSLTVPLSIDTPNKEAMETGLKAHRGKALLNSITGEKKKLDSMLPLIKKYQPKVILLCLDDNGIPANVRGALAVAEKTVSILAEEGMNLEDLFIDPLVHSLGANSQASLAFLESLKEMKAHLPGAKTVAGLSNVSYGLPNRKLLNRVFLALALQAGLDAAILDPLDEELQEMRCAAQALLGKDPSLKNYLRYYREKNKKRQTGLI